MLSLDCLVQFHDYALLLIKGGAMEWHDLLIDGYGRVPEFLQNVLKGLTQEDLNWQPRDDCNRIGWLPWHLTRQ